MTGTAKELNCMAQHSTERSDDGYHLMNEKKCRWCGKIIFVTPYWVFKRDSGDRVKYFCKYTCMKRYDEQLESKKRGYIKVK